MPQDARPSHDAVDFAQVFAALPTPYVLLSTDFRILAFDDAWLATTGRERNALLGAHLFEAFPPDPSSFDDDGRSPVETGLRQVLATAAPNTLPVTKYDIDDPVTGKPQERYWSISQAPVLDAEGRVAMLLQRAEDVTEFAQARERARLAEERGEQFRRRAEQVEADLFTQAHELSLAVAAREAAADRAAELAAVAVALTVAETVEDVGQIVVGRGVSVLGADGGAVVTLDDDGDWRITVNTALGEQVQATYGQLPYDSPLPACWTARHGERLLLPTRAAGTAFLPQMEQVYDDTARLGWAFLPLRVGSTLLGSLAVAWTDEHEVVGDELALLDGFAAQCAQALLRITSAAQERAAARQVLRLAEELQQALLTPPPEPDHLHVVVRYRPAADQAQVGGDWYDAFQQPDGATMLVIGDVVGHDGPAAARMGQLRGLLRALAYDADGTGHDTPSAVLTRVEHAARGLSVDTLATVVLGRVEREPDVPVRGTRRLRWSSAGHLPPVLLHPDGTSEVLDHEADLLLGVDPDTARRDHVVPLPDHATLLLFTDGLVERRGASLDEGIAELQRQVADLAAVPLERLCDTLLERLAPGTGEDDIALLAVRGYPEDRPRPAEAGPNRTPVTQPDA